MDGDAYRMTLSLFDAQLFEKVTIEKFPGKDTFSKTEILILLNEMTKAEKYYPRGVITKGSKYKIFKYFVRYCLYRNLANFDTMILMTGDKGTGKSSFAIMLSREWCSLLGISFSPKHHIAYSNNQVQERIDNLPRFHPLISDEAVNYASAAEWAKLENRDLRKKIAQVRTRNLFYILCWPMKINKIEKTYLDSFVNYWIHIVRRGIGAIFVKDINPVTDSWRLTLFKDLGGFTEFTGLDKIKKKLSSHPNFWYIITAPKPSEEFYKRYLVIREKNIYNTDGVLGNMTRQDILKSLLVKVLQDIMVRDSSLSMKRLLLHIKNEYGFDMKESDLKIVINDAEQLIDKLKTEKYNLGTFKDEADMKIPARTDEDDDGPEPATGLE
jgi:hypothetical protein